MSHRFPDLQFSRLLDTICRANSEDIHFSIAIHHDFHQSRFPSALIDQYNLHFVENYRPTKWGHVSKVPATLDTFALLQQKENPDWYITLSPNCYPIKPFNELANFLKNTVYDTFLEFRKIGSLEDKSHKERSLFTKYWFRYPMISRKGDFYLRSLRTRINKQKTPFNDNFEAYTGSDWMALSNYAVKKMLDAKLYDHPVIDYLSSINEAPDIIVSPIEMVIQSFFGNDKSLNHSRKNLHFIDWEGSVNWHPNTITMSHIDQIMTSEAFFARKFVSGHSEDIIEEIERTIL